jgi:hypothetical protein
METFLEYDKKTFDMVIHNTQERILKQIYERRLEEFEMRMEYLNIELRMEMGGDRGIHSTLKNTEEQYGTKRNDIWGTTYTI